MSMKLVSRRVAILFVLIVISFPHATLVSAANSAGGKCSKAGVTAKFGSKTLKCTKVGKKLVWVVQSKKSGSGSSGSGSSNSGAQPTSQKDIPAIIQNWGFNFTDFNSATGYAGDMLIKGVVPPTFTGANAAEDNAQYRHLIGVIGEIVRGAVEPQLAFIVLLGTAVTSMVTGTVCDVPKLYSDDYSIRIAPPGMSCMQGGAYILFEHEHVLAHSVKVGDKVTAGQKIAIASDYNPHWKAKGLGIIETGVFFSKKGSNAPWHACLTNYLDPSKKSAMLSTFSKALAAWETERSDSSLYNESAMSPVGCYTTEEMSDSNKGSG